MVVLGVWRVSIRVTEKGFYSDVLTLLSDIIV